MTAAPDRTAPVIPDFSALLAHYGRRRILLEIEAATALPQRPTVARIQAAVSARFDIPLAEMTSARRHRGVARPRQVAMYLVKRHLPLSLPRIGSHFGGRDHTTVLHALRQIEALRAIDPDLDQVVTELDAAIGDGQG